MVSPREYFERFVKLNEEEWLALNNCLHREMMPKRTLVLRESEVCDFVAVIVQGTCRFYYVKEGVEKVTAFFFGGEFFSNYRSFLTAQPSEHNIETLEETTVIKLYKADLHRLFDQFKIFERMGRLVAEQVYLNVTKRLDSFMFETPEERYADLLRRNSPILQEIPQYMIASYLGIQPESLSRIRKRKL